MLQYMKDVTLKMLNNLKEYYNGEDLMFLMDGYSLGLVELVSSQFTEEYFNWYNENIPNLINEI